MIGYGIALDKAECGIFDRKELRPLRKPMNMGSYN
jgi:hypothetical protein